MKSFDSPLKCCKFFSILHIKYPASIAMRCCLSLVEKALSTTYVLLFLLLSIMLKLPRYAPGRLMQCVLFLHYLVGRGFCSLFRLLFVLSVSDLSLLLLEGRPGLSPISGSSCLGGR